MFEKKRKKKCFQSRYDDIWVEPYRETISGYDRPLVNAGDVLAKVAEWFKQEKDAGRLANIDHVMLFTT